MVIPLLLLTILPYAEALDFNEIQGRWKLMYAGNYGYEFRFLKNYRVICILYHKVNAIVFKGIYTIEEGSKIRMNINEMKNSKSITNIDYNRKFIKASSSYFIFDGETIKENNKKILILKPQKVIIDGNSSDGYFEPEVKLNRQ